MDLEQALIDVMGKREPHVSSNSEPHAYFSEAGKCARQISLRIIHQNDPKPTTTYSRSLNSVIATKLGEIIHSQIQEALLLAEPNTVVELVAKTGIASGRVDGLYTNPDNERVVVEIKSMSDTMFSRSHKANTPDPAHLLQAMIGARALNATLVHMIYINKSPRANTPALREWILPIDNFLIDLELERLSNIVSDSLDGIVAPPEYQGEIIDNPDKHFWPCGFCEFSRECKEIGVPPPTSFNFF